MPWVGCYGPGYPEQEQYLTVRLHPSQFPQFPTCVKDAVDLNTKIDLFFNASGITDTLDNLARKTWKCSQYNLVTHAWVHHREQKGADVKKFPTIQIFEPLGVAPVNNSDGIGFNESKKMEVHLHPKDNRMAISPNNAHFRIIEGAPFASFWYTISSEDRTFIGRQCLTLPGENPFAVLVGESVANEDILSIGDHLRKLKSGKQQAIEQARERLEKLAIAFETQNPEAVSLFLTTLSPGEQKKIHILAWKLKQNENINNDPDFGELSFFGSSALSRKAICTPSEQGELIRILFKEQKDLFKTFLRQQKQLFKSPLQYPQMPEEWNQLQQVLEPVVHALKASDQKLALELFSKVPNHIKLGVYEIVWEMKNCPIVDSDFGEFSFFAIEKLPARYHCYDADRLNALILYLSQMKRHLLIK